MINFKLAYNRADFLNFLKTDFLPEDFLTDEEQLNFEGNYTRQVTCLGECNSLGLIVFEVQHASTHDARVGLSKEAFRLLYNRSTKNKALVLFVPIDNPETFRFSLVTIEVELDEQKVRKSFSNPRRYSYLLGEGAKVHTPTKFLLKPNEKNRRVKDAKDLQERFSVEVLTKEFYNELSDWYAWAIQHVHFPSQPITASEDELIEQKSKNVIRLLTRLLFVWFLKQKHLIPDQFFDEAYISENFLKEFAPNQLAGLFDHKNLESKYYKAILQNLFFAMLNCPITPQSKEDNRVRGFRKSDNWGQHRDANFLMRYENLFKDPQLFLSLANKTVPFLNGGLFDCLDNKSAETPVYIDGFSDNLPSVHKLIVPDYLFFGEEQGKAQDLSKFYGDKKKKQVNAKGLIDILKTYNFTIEENTPYDQEVSLDPELLGKVFENLLASYNPETKTTARKQTGSFYTPREIVQYMVDESLVAHLKKEVGDELELEFRKLMSFNENDLNLSNQQRKSIIKALFGCKIIDPACGSGAFPVGVLQQMVHILRKLDENNETWKEILIDDAITETNLAYREATNDERADMVVEIERNFNKNLIRPDYARKLYLIENCIYGVDIQAIAVQISKLRFFISLVVEQEATNDATDNFNIRPLPNLEAKFVAANTLIGIERKKPQYSLFENQEVKAKEAGLKSIRHKLFSAKNPSRKRKLCEQDKELRNDIAELLKDSHELDNLSARQLANWDPYDQNISSPFFDYEWMFGVKDGFDIVIGNPPYGVSIKGEFRKKIESYIGKVPDYEIYYYFIEIGNRILSSTGILSYIIPNTYLFNTFAEKYRVSLLEKWMLLEILDCSKFPIFESATILNTINVWQKGSSDIIGYRNTTNIKCFTDIIKKPKLIISKKELLAMNQNWGLAFCLDTKTINIVQKIKSNNAVLIDYFEVSQGYIPYRKSDLIIEYGKEEGEKIVNERLWHSNYKKDEQYIQEIFGRDINKYGYKKTESYIKYGEHLACHVDIRFFNSGRLLVREITNPTIIACLMSELFVNDPQIISVIKKKDIDHYSLKLLWATLNSKLATFFHFNHAPKATKGAFPKILVKDIKEFPLPSIDDGVKINLEMLVDKILFSKEANPKADTSKIEKEIDRLVYELYELTDEEIAIIENK